MTDSDYKFTEDFSKFVNGTMSSAAETGHELANDHRYLVNEKFKVVMAFIEKLADNYQKGHYDARNEYACKLANATIASLREKELYYSTL